MTVCSKIIWNISFTEDDNSERTEKVLANSFKEVISHYNEKAIEKIIKIEKTKEKATYFY